MIVVALPFGTGTPETKRRPYRNALLQAGVEPVENVATLNGLAGLVLAGGRDVDPGLYGESRGPDTEEPDCARDRLESALLAEALSRDLPVLAICRGLQLLNAVQGGSLRQHIDGHNHPTQREVHPVCIAPGSGLELILGTRDYSVNSRHHQCVATVGRDLVATATAPDGVVEALEMPGRRFVLAVQWHPEGRTDGPDARLFAAFRAAL
jgi:gamma-glutamyl-gamma-aminobutyrate hydrolase PuuD